MVLTILSGTRLVVAPFIAGLGHWYAPVLILGAIVAYLSREDD